MPIDIPPFGARTVIWVFAQQHLFFASFVLGAPIFIVICEYLGLRTKDLRYERLARETMKMVAVAYSITAIFGVLFSFILMGPYQGFTNYLMVRFYPVFLAYGLLILLETILMYTYWYSWDALARRKRLHISLGVVVNLVGTVMMMLMNAVGAFMLTPPPNNCSARLPLRVSNAVRFVRVVVPAPNMAWNAARTLALLTSTSPAPVSVWYRCFSTAVSVAHSAGTVALMIS